MSKVWRVVSFLVTCFLIVGVVVTGVALITGASTARIQDVASRRVQVETLPPLAQQALNELGIELEQDNA